MRITLIYRVIVKTGIPNCRILAVLTFKTCTYILKSSTQGGNHMKKQENKIRLNVLIPPRFKEALQVKAEKEGVTVTDIVTRALSKELRRKIQIN